MANAGFADEAKRIQELYLAGRKKEAEEAVPDDYLDAQNLVGPVERIKERWQGWESSGCTGINISTTDEQTMLMMAELTGARDRAAA